MDEAFGRPGYDPDDEGSFTRNAVFVIMAFNSDMEEAYHAIQESCAGLGLTAPASG
jgi:hypothetical protein